MARAAIGSATAVAVVWTLAPRANLVPERELSEVIVPKVMEIQKIVVETEAPPIEKSRSVPPASPPERSFEKSTPAPAQAKNPSRVEEARSTLETGRALVAAGSFPRLRASYGELGFERYREAMLALGAHFYLFDSGSRQPVARVEPGTGVLSDPVLGSTLSRWPRDVTRHLPELLDTGQREFGSAVSRVILLPPVDVDAALLGALEQYLKTRELEPRELARVDVVYTLVRGRLHCQVLALGMRDGRELAAALEVDLSSGGLS